MLRSFRGAMRKCWTRSGKWIGCMRAGRNWKPSSGPCEQLRAGLAASRGPVGPPNSWATDGLTAQDKLLRRVYRKFRIAGEMLRNPSSASRTSQIAVLELRAAQVRDGDYPSE